MKKLIPILFLYVVLLFSMTSCGSFVNGLASLYGNGNYNPYGSYWNNASASSASSNLTPNTAADAAYKSAMNNMTSGFWDNVQKDEQYKQQMIEATAKDVWAHPEKYQGTSTQDGNVNTRNFDSGGTDGGNSGSSTRTPTTSQHDLCNGTGKCKTCNGTGMAWIGTNKQKCPNCGGNGRCFGCNGTGRTSAHYY